MLTQDDIIALLQDYKRLVAIKNDVECDWELIKTTNPDAVASSGSGSSDHIGGLLAKREKELKQVALLIKRIDGWLEYLPTRESFYLRERYIDGRTKMMIRERYYQRTKVWYSPITWAKIRKTALEKLTRLSKREIPYT